MLSLFLAVTLAACAGGTASWRQCAVATLPPLARDQHIARTREVTRLQPGACGPAHLLGALLDAQGQPTEARNWLERARRICPEDPAILFDWGRVASDGGCSSEAIAALTEATLASPGDDAATRELNIALGAEATRFAVYDRQLGALGAGVEAALSAGRRPPSSLKDDWGRLSKSLENLTTTAPPDAAILLRLAELQRIDIDLGSNDARERAIELVERALELRPQWTSALTLLGTLVLTSQPSEPARAERAFLAAVNAAVATDSVSSAWLGLYMVYATTGRTTEADRVATRHLVDHSTLALVDRAAPPLDRGLGGR